MAIHPTLVSRQAPSQRNLTPQQALAISAWTDRVTVSLQNLELSASGSGANISESKPPIRGTSVPLTIPLDDPVQPRDHASAPRARITKESGEVEHQQITPTLRRREPSRRDSLRRREALLKGKEGSRRRQRWENDRLLNNPWAQPPSASDWLVQPTYPRHGTVPYYLAQLWDAHYAGKERIRGSKAGQSAKDKADDIPRSLRKKLKYTRAARGMLQDLEEDVRGFVQKWNERQLKFLEEGLENALSTSNSDDPDDEIIFIGRNGEMHDLPGRRIRSTRIRAEPSVVDQQVGEKMVFESLASDPGATFGRWLIHLIASYYGLYTWSVTVGDPARCEAYVGFSLPVPSSREGRLTFPRDLAVDSPRSVKIKPGDPLPRALWAQV